MFKTQLSAYLGRDELAAWQHMLLGGLSGGIGPCVNNPLDVVKTRLQKQVRHFRCCVFLYSQHGLVAPFATSVQLLRDVDLGGASPFPVVLCSVTFRPYTTGEHPVVQV